MIKRIASKINIAILVLFLISATTAARKGWDMLTGAAIIVCGTCLILDIVEGLRHE